MLDIVSRAIETGRGSAADGFSHADGTLPRFVPRSKGRSDTLDFRAVRSLDANECRATIPNGLMVYGLVTTARPVSNNAVSRVVTGEGEMAQRHPQVCHFVPFLPLVQDVFSQARPRHYLARQGTLTVRNLTRKTNFSPAQSQGRTENVGQAKELARGHSVSFPQRCEVGGEAPISSSVDDQCGRWASERRRKIVLRVLGAG